MGTIEAIGSDVARKDLKVGDKYFGCTPGAMTPDLDAGCFGQYAIVNPDAGAKVPSTLSDPEAATFGVSVSTVALCLYYHLGLPWPDNPAKNSPKILIWGGSTNVGLLAMQFAKRWAFFYLPSLRMMLISVIALGLKSSLSAPLQTAPL